MSSKQFRAEYVSTFGTKSKKDKVTVTTAAISMEGEANKPAKSDKKLEEKVRGPIGTNCQTATGN